MSFIVKYDLSTMTTS